MSNRWQYKVVHIKAAFLSLKPEAIEAQLNQLGLQGWELVSITMSGTAVFAYFKKEMS